jgi:hypothetical protein
VEGPPDSRRAFLRSRASQRGQTSQTNDDSKRVQRGSRVLWAQVRCLPSQPPSSRNWSRSESRARCLRQRAGMHSERSAEKIRDVSYDLAVWEGERPASDELAERVYMGFVNVYLDADEPSDEPPTPAIQRYVAALLERWPRYRQRRGRRESVVSRAADLRRNRAVLLLPDGVEHGRGGFRVRGSTCRRTRPCVFRPSDVSAEAVIATFSPER